jgi:integrase
MASITTISNKDGSTSWRVNWRVGEGKDRRQETATFKNYGDARKHRNEMDKQEQRRVGSTRRISVFEYLDEWIAARISDKKNPISPKTAEGYLRNIEIIKRGLKKDRLLSQLDKQHLDKTYDELLENGKSLPGGATGPLSKQTVLHCHRLMHKVLNDAVDNKLITENAAGRAEAPRVQGKKYKTKVRPFTKDETLLLFARAQDPICDPETYPMAACLAITGVRRGELAGLADDAVDWERGAISVFRNVVEVDGETVVKETKTEAGTRSLRIPAELIAVLREQRTRVLKTALEWGKDYQRKPLYLFPGVGGGPMHPKLITRRMERLIERAGITPGEGKKISPVHSWRHTTGTMLWRAFKDPKQIQGQLGHSTPAISMQLYTENTAEAETEAAEFLGGLIRDR